MGMNISLYQGIWHRLRIYTTLGIHATTVHVINIIKAVAFLVSFFPQFVRNIGIRVTMAVSVWDV